MRNAAFDRNLRRASWRYNARTIVLPVLLVTFGLVTFLLLAVNWRRADRERDVGAAPLRQSVARVTNVALQPVTRAMRNPRSVLTLRLPGFPAPATIYQADMTLHVGDRVLVAYQVGKSGRVYVEHTKRLPTAPTDRNEPGDLPR